MEGEKDNYREGWRMQEADRVGDMLVVVVLGVGKGQQTATEIPPSLLSLLYLP